eukprot:1299941-Pleurochrysis_carterae.AAC.1
MPYVYDLIACLSGWRSRTDRQVCHLEALRVVRAGVLDTLHLLLVLEDRVRQRSGPLRVAVAWAARVHLLVFETARRSTPRRSSLRVASFAAESCRCDRILVLFVGPLQAAETGTAMCAIFTRRIVSSITQLSLPNAFSSNKSCSRARPSPVSAAGRNLMMSRPSLPPA